VWVGTGLGAGNTGVSAAGGVKTGGDGVAGAIGATDTGGDGTLSIIGSGRASGADMAGASFRGCESPLPWAIGCESPGR